jgi:hypothetical protein
MPGKTPAPQPVGDRSVVLACSIRRLRRWWLEVRCGCRVAYLPLRMMAANRGLAGATLADVVVQLRCEKCRQRPIAVALVNDPAGEAPGRWGAGGWRVVLIEADQTAPP